MQQFFAQFLDCDKFRKQDEADIAKLNQLTQTLSSSTQQVTMLLGEAAEDEEHPLHGSALMLVLGKDVWKLQKAVLHLNAHNELMTDVAVDHPEALRQWRCWDNTQRGEFWFAKAKKIENME